MCSVYKELITQLIEEGDLWEQLGITHDDKNFILVNFSMELFKDIDDLDEKFNKLIDEECKVFNDTNYFSAFKDLNKRWAVGGYGIVDANSIGKSKPNKKKRYKPTIFHSGHILAQRLFRGIDKGICLNYYNVNNIYPQTELSNRGSVFWGKKSVDNQSYYESYLEIKALEPGKRFFYRAKLVYGKDEIVPRGIRLQAVEVNDGNLGMYMDKSKILFNVFIPNIFPDFLPNYREITLIGEQEKI